MRSLSLLCVEVEDLVEQTPFLYLPMRARLEKVIFIVVRNLLLSIYSSPTFEQKSIRKLLVLASRFCFAGDTESRIRNAMIP